MLAKTLLLLLPMSLLALAAPVTDLAKRASSVQYTLSQAFTNLAQTAPFVTLDNGILFIMQTDGNFVIYQNGNAAAANAVWSSNTGGYDCSSGNCWVNWQTDGNLVVYVKGGKAKWSSNTAGKGSKLLLSNQQPYMRIYDSGGNAIWSTPRPTTPPTDPCSKSGVCPRSYELDGE